MIKGPYMYYEHGISHQDYRFNSQHDKYVSARETTRIYIEVMHGFQNIKLSILYWLINMHLLSSKNEFKVILYVLGSIKKSYHSFFALREPLPLYHTILTFWFTPQILTHENTMDSRKHNPGDPRSHELAEQTDISERKSLEKLFPVKKI